MRCILLLFIPFLFSQEIDKYFVTVCDSEHYNWAVEQIDSIHKHNKAVKEIAIYDLKLTEKQRKHLSTLPQVVVRDLEEKNPFMREQFIVRPNGRMSRGWYSWKPIALYDAIQKAPYFLFMDAGVRSKTNLNPIFLHTVQNKSFFITTGHSLEQQTTKQQMISFSVHKEELYLPSIQSNVMGITKDLIPSLLRPAYDATENIKNFEDDGSSKMGFGYARHDQSVLSIIIHKAKIPILDREKDYLLINGEKVPFSSHYFFKFKPV